MLCVVYIANCVHIIIIVHDLLLHYILMCVCVCCARVSYLIFSAFHFMHTSALWYILTMISEPFLVRFFPLLKKEIRLKCKLSYEMNELRK